MPNSNFLGDLCNKLQGQELTSKLYTGCSITGPRFNTSEGRWCVTLWFPETKERITLSLARFRYQEHVGRILDTSEEVDHKDENKTNDVIENLQILSHIDNIRKTHQIYPDSEKVICVWCKKSFTLTRKQIYTRNTGERLLKAGPFCSKRCVGQYGKSLQ